MTSVLIVEDDAAMRDGLAALLDVNGMEARVAADGVEGLALLNNGWRPDLILLDQMMPRMNGVEFRQAQRANPAIADIPVVLITGSTELDRLAADIQPSAVLQKPFPLKALLQAIGEAVGS